MESVCGAKIHICSVLQAAHLAQTSPAWQWRHHLSHLKALPTTKVYRAVSSQKCPSLISTKVPLFRCVVVWRLPRSKSGWKCTSCSHDPWPDITLWNDQATLFTYFAPRCICIVYPWFCIFLQSKSPKMEKHTYEPCNVR